MSWRQVDLFTRRIRKPPSASEFALHCAIMDTIRIGKAPGWIVLHPANGEHRNKATAGRLKRMGVLPGASDLILIGPPHATVHAMEIKAKGNRPDEAQTTFLRAVRAAGGHATWCDSYDQALVILKLWGAVSDRVRVSA